MSWFFKIFGGRDKVRKEACHQDESENLPEAEELLRTKEVLAKKIDQELLFAKKNCTNNGQLALQALRRKKCYQKHLEFIDCAVEAMLSSTRGHIDIVNEVIKDIAEEQDGTENMPDTLHTSMCFEVEFDEDELLAELERLKKSLLELDRVEERVSCPKVSSTASTPAPSYPAKTEEEEIEEQLEHLRRWLNKP